MAYKRADQHIQMSEAAVRKSLATLKQPGDLFEIRIIADKSHNMSGYFNEAEKAVTALKTVLVWKGSQVYYTINRILPECFSREQHNCFVENVDTTKDNDIEKIVTLLIDCDPVRRTGISSTEEERGFAREVAHQVVTLTREAGWPEPVQAMSGNGYHCQYALEPLANTKENIELIAKVLQVFDQQCSTEKCKIDTSVFNPSRITKLYGVVAQKGSNTDERPHRMSKIISVPDVREKLSRDQLEAVAALWKAPPVNDQPTKRKSEKGASDSSQDRAGDNAKTYDPAAPRKSCRKYKITDLGEYLDSLGIKYGEPKPYRTGQKYILEHCVFDDSHTAPDAAVFQYPDGLLGYRCLHDSCQGKRFSDFIRKVDPDRFIEVQNKDKVPITIEALEDEYTERGVSIRMNMITHEIEVISDEPDLDFNSLVTTTHSNLKGTGNYTGVTFDTLSAYSQEIAKDSRYNPVLEYLNTVQYDGKDQLGDLFDLIGIDKEDELSRTLIRKWFLQGIALLHNTEDHAVPAEGVLTFQGPQRCGKTSLVKHFAIKDEWFFGGATLNPDDKDTVRRCCSYWITELGEVETTLRRDIEALKNFITCPYDQYRVPFGRFDFKFARRTNLAATCNSDRYLIDQTGNRRWWTVPVSKFMNYSDILAFPCDQLWAQALQMYRQEGPDCFRLTSAEHEDLNERNNRALKPAKAEDEVRDILTLADAEPWNYTWAEITVTEWKDHFDSLRKYDSSTLGKVLSKLDFTQRQDGNRRFYRLPVWKHTSVSLMNEKGTG